MRSAIRKPDLAVSFAGIKLKNPVLTASGTFGYGEEYQDLVDLDRLGGVIVKGISFKPIAGTRRAHLGDAVGYAERDRAREPRRRRVHQGETAFLRKYDTAVIVNIFGYSLEDYVAVTEQLDGTPGIAGLE